MARHHMTSKGKVPFTSEEEAEWDAEESHHNSPEEVEKRHGKESSEAEREALKKATKDELKANKNKVYSNKELTNIIRAILGE